MNVITAAITATEIQCMTYFTIDNQNNLIPHPSADDAAGTPGGEGFTTAAELSQLAANWPAARLVEIWNNLPAAAPVKRFTDRQTAVTRIWKAIQTIPCLTTRAEATAAAQEPHVPPAEGSLKNRASKRGGASGGRKKASCASVCSKKDMVLALLQQTQGATVAEIIDATGWLPHSVRGFLSGVLGRKMKLTIKSAKREDGVRAYSIRR
jgi:hypothetical protein